MYHTYVLVSLLAALSSLSSASPFIPRKPVPALAARADAPLLANENGFAIDMSWLNNVPASDRSNINIPGVVANGNLINPAPPGSTAGANIGGSNAGNTTDTSQPPATTNVPPPTGSPPPAPATPPANDTSSGTSPPPPPPPPATPPTNSTAGGTPPSAGGSPPPSSSSAPPTSGSTPPTPITPAGNATGTSGATGAGGCPSNMKGVTFNGGFNPGMFDTIGAASEWITFGLHGADAGSDAAKRAYIPMMAFASDVPDAISIVSAPNPPQWLLTFNEPDYSYAGVTPTMTPQQAADAIAPLLKVATSTKFVAPVPADSGSDWLDQFFAACNCKSRFSAYNIHIYAPTSAEIIAKLNAFHAKYSDQPVWLTEVAPGMANPACSLGWDTVTTFMNDVYRFAAQSGFVPRVFWNSGNQIGGGDQNVCNSYLLGSGGGASPLLKSYQDVNCS